MARSPTKNSRRASTCRARPVRAAGRALEEAGVILGYHAWVDSGRIGCPETLFVWVKLHSDIHDDMVAPDTAHYQRIHDRLTGLHGVERVESSLVMHTAIRRTVLPMA